MFHSFSYPETSPALTSSAKTSPAIAASFLPMMSAALSDPLYDNVIWSVTSNPASFLLDWILLTTARTNPSSHSSSDKFVSSTTVTPLSASVTNPSCFTISINRSSSANSTGVPSTSNVNTPLESN